MQEDKSKYIAARARYNEARRLKRNGLAPSTDPRCQNGKIYAIRSKSTDKIYIGSTWRPLADRFNNHKSSFTLHQRGLKNFTSSSEILEFGDAYIELLELFPCKTKEELHAREGHWIRTTETCVNHRTAGGKEKGEVARVQIAKVQKARAQRDCMLPESDARFKFLREWSAVADDAFVLGKDLYVLFTEWCTKNGEDDPTTNQHSFLISIVGYKGKFYKTKAIGGNRMLYGRIGVSGAPAEVSEAPAPL